MLIRIGVDIRTVADLAGHSSVQTTLGYVATDDKRKQAAQLALEEGGSFAPDAAA